MPSLLQASSKGVLSSVSGEALTAWGTPTDTDADSSAQATYLHCDGPFDEACTLPATTGAASSSYCDMQQWPFASEQRSTANLDLALHAALADPHSEALAAPEQAAYPGCLDSLSRACSARAPLRAIPTHVAVQVRSASSAEFMQHLCTVHFWFRVLLDVRCLLQQAVGKLTHLSCPGGGVMSS